MPEKPELSEARRAVVEKYLRGEIPQVTKAMSAVTHHDKAEASNQRARLVKVQIGGPKRPFFFLHGDWKGTAFFCLSLARELGLDQPFFALEPYQFGGLAVPPTVETMATAHIEVMRTVQPEGPYLLGGWCNGGLVAYEMARQLHTAGQRVDLLVLMDPMYLGYRTLRKLIRGIISHSGTLMGIGPDKQLDWFLHLLYVCKPLRYAYYLRSMYVRLRNMYHGSSQDSVHLIVGELISLVGREVTTIFKRFSHMFGHGQEHVVLPSPNSLIPTAEVLRQDYLGIFEWVDMGYMPSSLYPGKITFFWPRDDAVHAVSGGWRKVIRTKGIQEAEVYVLPGSQSSWRTEHLHDLAERLRTCLSEAQKEVK